MIHDGQHLYQGSKECLKYLQAQNKKVIFLSNAPYRAARVIKMLENLGIEKNLYHKVISSGEATHSTFKNSEIAIKGKKYFFIGFPNDKNLLEETDYFEVKNIADADFILLTDFNYDGQNITEIMPFLETAQKKKLPLICTNPDKQVVTITGEVIFCPGMIAEKYEEMGGEVIYFGKPYPLVYHKCLDEFPNIPKERVIAIGDNLETDIVGAANMDIASLLITGGILKPIIGIPESKDYHKKLELSLADKKSIPDFVIYELQ